MEYLRILKVSIEILKYIRAELEVKVLENAQIYSDLYPQGDCLRPIGP